MYWLMTLVIAGGAALAVQAAVNGRLGRELGNPTLAALASFVIGAVGLVLYLVAARSPLAPAEPLSRVPWWAWTGGLLGGFYVVIAIVGTPRLGVAVTMSLVVAGQLLTSVVLDHFGWLGVDARPLSLARVLGLLLVVAGVVLVRRF